MVKSMTGYGRAQETVNGMNITIELKSVNHRYFEFSCRVPRGCAFLEDKLKNSVHSKISRGKVDLYLTLDTSELGDTTIEIDRSFADAYIKALHNISEIYGVKDDVTVSVVARNSDVFNITKAEIDEDAVWNAVETVTDKAVAAFIDMRAIEGIRLRDDVISRMEVIGELVSYIEERSPQTVKEYREKLEERLKELLGDVKVDEQRLITETGIMADKLAVCEETVRLNSHMQQLRALLNSDEPVGRKIDFLVQEMNREANTIGSKAQDVEIARRVIDIKSEIEKIREQIQNIE